MDSYLLQAQRPGHPQRPRERPAALREIEARGIGMHMCAPTTQSATNIRQEVAAYHDDTQ
jgi:hypothetical protein